MFTAFFAPVDALPEEEAVLLPEQPERTRAAEATSARPAGRRRERGDKGAPIHQTGRAVRRCCLGPIRDANERKPPPAGRSDTERNVRGARPPREVAGSGTFWARERVRSGNTGQRSVSTFAKTASTTSSAGVETWMGTPGSSSPRGS